MNSSVYKISLDIHQPESQVVLDMKKLDSKRRIQISLTEDGWAYQIASDCMAVFTAEKTDGNFVFNGCVIDGNIITYDVTAQTTACEGEVACEIRLIGGDGKIITSPRFTIIVHNTVYNGEEIIESAPEADALQDMINESNSLYDKLKSLYENGEFKGDKGDTGAQGEQGIQGMQGEPGNDALINGKNALLIQQGEGIVFKQKDDVLTIGSNSIPRVYELPETAEKGEICLYNTPVLLSQRDENGRVTIPIAELQELSTREDSGEFYLELRKNGIDAGYFQIYFSDGYCNFYYQIFESGSSLYSVALHFINGIFDKNNSSIEENGEYTYPDLSAYPEAYTLPEFDSVEYTAVGDLPERFGNMCHLMEYDNGWKEVSSLLKINDKLLELINAVADINGSVDEIEAIIDESGVLE